MLVRTHHRASPVCWFYLQLPAVHCTTCGLRRLINRNGFPWRRAMIDRWSARFRLIRPDLDHPPRQQSKCRRLRRNRRRHLVWTRNIITQQLVTKRCGALPLNAISFPLHEQHTYSVLSIFQIWTIETKMIDCLHRFSVIEVTARKPMRDHLSGSPAFLFFFYDHFNRADFWQDHTCITGPHDAEDWRRTTAKCRSRQTGLRKTVESDPSPLNLAWRRSNVPRQLATTTRS